MPSLFEPIDLGPNLHFSHRVVLAPLTRFRANQAHVHGPLATEYYTQRASAHGTLLITEGTFISPRAGGYSNVPGIYTQDQIEAWKNVTEAVHKKGSSVFLQLWAMGRAADLEVLKKEGVQGGYVSSSAIALKSGKQAPKALSEEEIWEYIQDYAQASKNAVAAGFDGVEVHCANGYLIDQFTQDTCNQRTDGWGGSMEKRSRFALEVTKAVVAAVGADRVGARLSPYSTFQGMRMTDPIPQFSHLITGLKELKLAYLHLVESRISGNADVESTEKVDFALQIWARTSPVLLAGGFQPESAKRAMEEYPNNDIMVVFGRHFISNPDLPFRLREGLPLTPYDRDTFYVPESPKGYIDYPFSREWEAQSRL